MEKWRKKKVSILSGLIYMTLWNFMYLSNQNYWISSTQELYPNMNVQNNKYSEINVIIVPIIMLNKAEYLLCFRIFIPVAISVIPPIKK